MVLKHKLSAPVNEMSGIACKAGATQCCKRWLRRWAERSSRIISTAGAANVSAARCGECLNRRVWCQRLPSSKETEDRDVAIAAAAAVVLSCAELLLETRNVKDALEGAGCHL
jgi:hypothetical protein